MKVNSNEFSLLQMRQPAVHTNSANYLHLQTQLARMLDDLEQAGFSASPLDLALLRAYAKGNVTNGDMLTHAAQFDALDAYNEWLHDRGHDTIEGFKRIVSHDQVIEEMRCLIVRRARLKIT